MCLLGIQEAVGDTDPHHEVGNSLALTADTADRSRTVALGINAPGAEIGSQPLWRDGVKAIAGKTSNLIHALPRVFLAFQPLYPLRRRFFLNFCHCSISPRSLRTKEKAHRQMYLAVGF